jgi:hypothetical protein
VVFAVVVMISLTDFQLLNPGDYVASPAGICKPAVECSDDEDEEDEGDRMEILTPGLLFDFLFPCSNRLLVLHFHSRIEII